MFQYFLDFYDFLVNDVLFNSTVVIFLTLIYVKFDLRSLWINDLEMQRN